MRSFANNLKTDLKTVRFRLSFHLIFLFLCLLSHLSPLAYAEQEMLPYGNLTVSLVNGLTGLAIANEEIYLQRIEPDGSRTSLSVRYTDKRGLAGFQIDALDTGVSCIVKVRPFNGGWIESVPFSTPGVVTIEAGVLPVTVMAGDGSGPLTDTTVWLYEIMEDESMTYIKSGYTDASGMIVFDAPDIGNGRTYVLKAKSPIDRTMKTSPQVTDKGGMTFTVGNSPLVVTLVDSITGEPLAGLAVTVRKVVPPDGSLEYVVTHETDDNGQVVFDLDGLGSGTDYVLYTVPYNGGGVYSSVISDTDEISFDVGNLPVTVVAGDGSGPMVDEKVYLYEIMADGSYKYSQYGYTDSSGLIVFHAPDISQDRPYVLRAQSPVNGTTKYSAPITAQGAVTFTVGNFPLNVTLVNGISGQPITGQAVKARKILPDGSYKTIITHETNEQGLAVFDLDDLGSGTDYVLYTVPYNGGSVYSPRITQTGDLTFRVGMVPVTLTDLTTGNLMPDKELTAYEKTAEGKLIWTKKGTTDSQGIVRFDLDGADDGGVYVIRAYNPFGDNNSFYSPLIVHTGPVEMTIRCDQTNKLDRTPPDVSIISPITEQRVADDGFTLTGRTTDNQVVTTVTVKITDPVKGVTEETALLNSISGYWTYTVDAAAITVNNTVIVEVSAMDDSYNIGTTTARYTVIRDAWPPQLSITSHQNDDRVFSSGFILSGTISDHTGVTRLVASIIDSNLGLTVENLPVEFSSDGTWNLVVHDAEVSTDAEVLITVRATDAANNTGSRTVLLYTLDSALNGSQLVNRITFGATPELLSRIQKIGPEAYLTEQLYPDAIDDSELETMIESQFNEISSSRDLQDYQLTRAIYTNRQLQEVMTWFWENHFNTYIRNTGWELTENHGFREHALGYFRDLLTVSATSPAMLRYLDNVYSHKNQPNENYARELMELHTLGVNGGYTQQDVVDVARVFTGWRYKDDAFYFASYAHDYEDKTVLGHTIIGEGVNEGEAVLDILAEHPSTAEFICTKLLRKLVEDEPTAQSVSDCAAVFQSSGGHIGTVVEHILRSHTFNSEERIHKKVKTPFEFIAGMMRNFDAEPGDNGPRYALQDMGMPLFRNLLPTGYAEVGSAWTDSNLLMLRQQYSTKTVFRDVNENYTYLQLPAFFIDRDITTAQGVVGFLFQVALGNDYSQTEWDTAMGVLTMDGNMPFDIYAEDAENQLQTLAALVMSFPSYQLQ